MFIKEVKIKSQDLAKLCVELAYSKKAISPIILKVKELTNIADYFMICGGTSSTHLKTIANHIVESLGKKGVKKLHYEADKDNSWIILDYSDVIIHIMSDQARGYYKIEQLWETGKKIRARNKPARKPSRTAKSIKTKRKQ